MQIRLDDKVMDWNNLKFDIKLMWQERIGGEFLRRDLFKLAWFKRYQTHDIKRLESILSQACEQYEGLPKEEQQWVKELQDFYDDLRSFNWDKYNLLMSNEPRRLKYERETGIRWAERIRRLIAGYIDPYKGINPELDRLDDPLEYLLSVAETEYIQGPLGIWRPKGMVEGDNND